MFLSAFELLFWCIQEKWSPLHSLALSFQIFSMDKLLESGHDIDFLNKVRFFILYVCQFLHNICLAVNKIIWSTWRSHCTYSHLFPKGASPHVKDKVWINYLCSYTVDCVLQVWVCVYIYWYGRMELLHFIMQFKLVQSKLWNYWSNTTLVSMWQIMWAFL